MSDTVDFRVEQAAKALFESVRFQQNEHWSDPIPDDVRWSYREKAAAALRGAGVITDDEPMDAADRIETVAQAIYDHDRRNHEDDTRDWLGVQRDVAEAYRRRAAAALVAVNGMERPLVPVLPDDEPDKQEPIYIHVSPPPAKNPDDAALLRDMRVIQSRCATCATQSSEPFPTLRSLRVHFPVDGIGIMTFVVAGPTGEDVEIQGTVYDFIVGGMLHYPEGERTDMGYRWLRHRMRGEAR